MDFKKNQNRREFLKTAGRYLSLGGLSLLGISAGVKGLSDKDEPVCEVNLPCRNCFKLGNCQEDKAVEMRDKIKSETPVKHFKGVKND